MSWLVVFCLHVMEVSVSNSIVKGLAKMMGAIALGSLLVVGAAVPAAAQGLTGATTAVAAVTATQVSLDASQFALPANLSFIADANADQGPRPGVGAPTHTMGGKQVMVMVQGGLFHNFNTGFTLGAGVAFKPMKDNNKFEVGGDFNYARYSGLNGVYVAINGQYDIHLQQSKAVPFLGGGIGIAHFSGGTNTDPEILGGVDFETSGGQSIRAQVRFFFTPVYTTTIVLVGFAF